MLDEEQLAAAKKICELFLWEKPESIEITFAELKNSLANNYDINNAVRISMPWGAFYTFGWNEHDLLFLDYLIVKAKHLQIPLPHNLSEVEEITNSEAEGFYCDVIDRFSQYNFDAWMLDLDKNCICITPLELREEIIDAATKIGLGLLLQT